MTTQKYREVEIETPLGADVLLLKDATITEALSQPFVIDLQLLSRQEDIRFEDLLGENAALRIAGFGTRLIMRPERCWPMFWENERIRSSNNSRD